MDEIIIFITTPSKKEAEKIGRYVVENRLAACANILPKITSIFAWEGKIHNDSEALLILKTKKRLFQQVADEVKKRHSYSVPEIVALSLVEGSAAYLEWIQKNTL